MKKLNLAIFVALIALLSGKWSQTTSKTSEVLSGESKNSYWFELHRKSNKETLYFGVPGETENSKLVKEFMVKTGKPGERPTPLPQLLGRDYWLLTAKREALINPETAPYFLVLDIPISDQVPFGPVPYEECGGQCNWQVPGEFGLHGVGGDNSKLSEENEGSSGCIRHADEDITYLYELLNPSQEEIRYYIKDI